MKIKHANLFSGIGGFFLAAEWCGWENIFAVEIEDYPSKVLQKNFPNIQKFKDIYDFDGTKFKGTIDIISGGFPCQPFSVAGKRRGTRDNRYLWPEMLRVISEIKPTFVVGENVAGLVSMENGKTLERIFFDLENEGYTIESFIIPACSIGAWHRRNRVWIIAYSRLQRQEEYEKQTAGIKQYSQDVTDPESSGTSKDNRRIWQGIGGINRGQGTSKQNASNTNNQGFQRYRGLQKCSKEFLTWSGSEPFKEIWESEPKLGRVAHGISSRVDRLKCLGNTVVVPLVYEIFKAINKYYEYNINNRRKKRLRL